MMSAEHAIEVGRPFGDRDRQNPSSVTGLEPEWAAVSGFHRGLRSSDRVKGRIHDRKRTTHIIAETFAGRGRPCMTT